MQLGYPGTYACKGSMWKERLAEAEDGEEWAGWGGVRRGKGK
jgi:hypothetical protein